MKIAWINPSFLDYRIPLYAELNKLLNGDFHLIYGENIIPQRCNLRVKSELGANAHPLTEKRYHFGKKSDFSNSGVTLAFPKGINKIIKSIQPDLIIVEGYFKYSPFGIWYGTRKNVPIMLAYERTAHTERNAQRVRIKYRKFINKYIDGFIANGKLTKDYLISQGVDDHSIFTGGMCADSFGLARSCSCFDDNERLDLKRALNINEGLTYIFVGRLIKLKGVIHLLEGWETHSKRFPADNLLLVGDGNVATDLKEYVTNNNLKNVHFMGNVDYNSIYKYYAISDVFVIPTLEDNWSLVVPEAMACGLPIACSIYNGCWPELVQHDVNGTTFDPLNRQTVEAALNYFHHVDLNAFGKASIAIENDFSPARTAEKIVNAIKQTLSNSSK